MQILCDQITDADILFIPRKLERQSENIFSFSCSHVQTTSINKSVSQTQAVKKKKTTKAAAVSHSARAARFLTGLRRG